MLISHDWLRDYLGAALPDPDKVVELLTFHAFEIDGVDTVGTDTVYDVNVLPDRASDCLSHRGIARELAAILDVPLVHDPLRIVSEPQSSDAIRIRIEDPEACPRFTVAHVRGVAVIHSPQWLQDRLRSVGQRPINIIVDITNYVMYDIGQPLHAYDASRFPKTDGVWHFGVRYASPDERIALLAEGGADTTREVALYGGELLIVDQGSDTPVGLAGVKGGTFAGVDESTTDILVEAAHFDPTLTRKTARRHKIVIDASKRFENEPSRELALYAQAEVVRLLQLCGVDAAVDGLVDEYPRPYQSRSVDVRPSRVNQILGSELDAARMCALLQRIECTVNQQDGILHCTPPFSRTDLQLEENFIEEIGRLHGYHHIPVVLPETREVREFNAVQYYTERVRAVLLDQGFSEVITSSFRKKDHVTLQNAFASDKASLRSNLSKNLQEALDRNITHVDLLGVQDIRLFEIGTVFAKDHTGIAESLRLGIGVRCRATGYSGKEDAILKTAMHAVQGVFGTTVHWDEHKGVAEVDLTPLVAQAEPPTEYTAAPTRKSITYTPFSVYPAVSRDIALWVSTDTTSDTVAKCIEAQAGEWLQRVTLFDEYHKDNSISFAFRLVFQSHERTLTDAEVNARMEHVYTAVTAQGWEVR